MTETADALANQKHRVDRTGSPVIRASGIWKIFGPNPERLVGSEDALLPRAELRAKTGNVVASQSTSVGPVPGKGGSAPFSISVDAKDVVAFRYKPLP